MITRRDLLRGIGVAAAATTIPEMANASVSSDIKPVVVSTWKFGMDANAAAWKILSNNGTALDAVEAGARVPEADPTVTSVGLGGLPDRDGVVALDGCVMDENGNTGAVL